MTYPREQIIAWAREADWFGEDGRLYSIASMTPETITRFAAIIEQATIERCAKECDAWTKASPPSTFGAGSASGAKNCAAAIRALGDKHD